MSNVRARVLRNRAAAKGKPAKASTPGDPSAVVPPLNKPAKDPKPAKDQKPAKDPKPAKK